MPWRITHIGTETGQAYVCDTYTPDAPDVIPALMAAGCAYNRALGEGLITEKYDPRRTVYKYIDDKEAFVVNGVRVGHRLTDPDDVWGTITAMVTGENGYVIVTWDDESQDDTLIPLKDLHVEKDPS